MVTVDDIKAKLEQLLIAKGGDVEPYELINITEEAAQLGISKERIRRLLAEVDRSINWQHISAKNAAVRSHNDSPEAAIRIDSLELETAALKAQVLQLKEELAKFKDEFRSSQAELRKQLHAIERGKVPGTPKPQAAKRLPEQVQADPKHIMASQPVMKPSNSPMINYVQYRAGKR